MSKIYNHLPSTICLFIFILPLFFLVACGTRGPQTKEQCDSLIMSARQCMREKQYQNAIQMLTEAKKIADENNWNEQHFNAVNQLAKSYYEMYNFNESLNMIIELYDFAEKNLPPEYTLKALNNMAVLYCEEEQYDKAAVSFQKIYDYAKEHNDSLLRGATAINLSKINQINGNLPAAEQFIDEAIATLPKAEVSQRLMAKENKANILISNKKFNEAKSILDEIQPHLTPTDDPETHYGMMLDYSKIAEHERKTQAAAAFAKKALASNDLQFKASVYSHISAIYQKARLFEQSIAYLDSAMQIKDSLQSNRNHLFYENSKIKLDLLDSQTKLMEQQVAIKFERWIFTAFAILIVIVIWVLRMQIGKNKQKRKMAEQQQKIVELELEDAQNKKIILENQLKEREMKARIEKSELYDQIETKNRELTAKALHLSSRNDLIKETLDFLSKIDSVNHNAAYNQYLLKLKSQLRNDTEMENFLTYFEEVNSTFMASLREKHPYLNANDLRFIAYTYMGLNTKEIASLLNITIEACKKRKQRISAKMHLDDTSSLFSYLSTL